MNTGATGRPEESDWYEVRLRGLLDPRWSTWLDGMDVTSRDDGTTVLAGHVVDQSALHGLLTRIRDIGLPLISVARVEPDNRQHPTTTNTDKHDDPTGD